MSSKPAIVTTKYGKVEGDFIDGLYIFKGIPYAAPPTGELRWLPPQPPKPWQGVKPAKKFGAIAPQTPMPDGLIAHEPQEQSEDCLFLNIWTQGLDNKRRPVMVWIHGGAFTIGSGSEAMYDTGTLSKRGDVVLVSINYRLGTLGFLRLKDATGGKIPATGNEGLMDQVAALKWVKENIDAFGGDPKNVTVFGESAGGMSIGCLMAMPSAKGLFHKGILESGVGSTAGPKDEADRIGEIFLKVAGIKKDDVKALRALTPAQLLQLEMKMRTAAAGPGEVAKITTTAPVVDGEIIPDIPNKTAKKGYSKVILTIIGTNLEEWKLFAMMQPDIGKLSEADMIKRLGVFVQEDSAKQLVAAYKKAREKRGQPVTPVELLSAVQSDLMFRMPAIELAEAQRDNGQKVYTYLFDWKSPVMGGALGACHALEIGFVFGSYDDTFCGSGPDADKLARNMQDAWFTFARTGNPSCECIGKWPEYGAKRQTMMLGKTCRVEAAPYDEERQAWDNTRRDKVAMP